MLTMATKEVADDLRGAEIVHAQASCAPAGAPIEFAQKLCDAYDWASPDIDRIICTKLRETPRFHRKQWEYAIIYLALERAGVLHANSRGIAFGAGRERLIFAIAEQVGHLLVTDLYDAATKWGNARTSDPRAFVLAAAPPHFPTGNIDVARMDMTKLDYAGPPVDFCYSSCSFEHIGAADEAFVDHLRQVRQVLKPGGVYALTTELNYGGTIPIPHSYFFNIEHLLGLCRQSGLSVDPVFDARLRRAQANVPSTPLASFGVAAGNSWNNTVTVYRDGRTFTSCQVVLRNAAPSSAATRVLGYRESEAWVADRRRQVDRTLWTDWQFVSLATHAVAPAPGHDEFAETPRSHVLHSASLNLAPGRHQLRVVPPAGARLPATLRVRAKSVQVPMVFTQLASLKLEGGEAQTEFTVPAACSVSVVGDGLAQQAREWAMWVRRV